LDEAFDMVQKARLVSGESPPHYQWKRIDRQTNVAEKHKLVLAEAKRFAGNHIDDQDCLVSLSNARNCLSHDLGIVTQKRLTNGCLAVCWVAIRTLIQQGDKTIDLDTIGFPFELDPNGPDGLLLAKVEITEKTFALGEHLSFTSDDLLGICFFYQMVIDRVTQGVQKYAQDSGVVFQQAQLPGGETSQT